MATQTLRNNISSYLSSKIIGNSSNLSSNFTIRTGKVISVLMNDTTPSGELFVRDGAWAGIGTIYFVDYPTLKETNETITNIDLLSLPKAIPLFPDKKYIPLVEELVLIISLPSKDAQSSSSDGNENYYVSVINLFNNHHHNSLAINGVGLGRVFEEKESIRYTLPFEGDTIYESRFGSSLHFTSTVKKFVQPENWWSVTGDNGSPITFLTNGYFINPKSFRPHVEDLKNDSSLLVLSSTQLIPYLPKNKFSDNSIFNPVLNYTNSQAMLIADRITINAKKDEILLYSNQLGALTDTSIYLESKGDITLNAPLINLGLNSKGQPPIEPVLLGDKTSELIIDLLKLLQDLSKSLSTALGTMPGTPLLSVNNAGVSLLINITNIISKYNSDKNLTSGLDKLKSKTTYTI